MFTDIIPVDPQDNWSPKRRALLRYRQHRAIAKHRGIAWGFTFDTWIQTWLASGYWEVRGDKSRFTSSRYVMGRCGDMGPYAPYNVHIITQSRNSKDAYRYKHLPTTVVASA